MKLYNNSTSYDSKTAYRDAVWSENANENMWDIYLSDGDHGMKKYAIPGQSDDFSNLPRTYVEVAEMDVLHDEGLTYADNLKKAGVEVSVREISGAYHGFDADQDNAMVKGIIEDRIKIMNDMLTR